MYVCLCNGIRDSELKELGSKGVRNPDEAYRRLNAEFACASCKDEAEEILCSANGQASPHLKVVSG